MCVCGGGGRVKSWSGGTWRCRVVVELDGGSKSPGWTGEVGNGVVTERVQTFKTKITSHPESLLKTVFKNCILRD